MVHSGGDGCTSGHVSAALVNLIIESHAFRIVFQCGALRRQVAHSTFAIASSTWPPLHSNLEPVVLLPGLRWVKPVPVSSHGEIRPLTHNEGDRFGRTIEGTVPIRHGT
jgi:hypothetical protein